MHSPRLAEAYCDRMHEATQKQNGQHKKALWGSHAENSSYEMYLALIKASTHFQSAWPVPLAIHLPAKRLTIIAALNAEGKPKMSQGNYHAI